jgi:tetratricopeptide (TPR) repeat protein
MPMPRTALFVSAALTLVLTSQAALAGDAVQYGSAPGWVEQADLAPVLEGGDVPATVLNDVQSRLERGVVATYVDSARRLANPQSLMQDGTLALQWLPDKGDLTVHRLDIIRGDEAIDLLAQGVTFDVIRREMGLEQRLLDGSLTATLAVPGLRVNDVLRVAYTTTTDDQALGEEVQEAHFLPAQPWDVGMARVIVSWPEGEEMYWAAEPRVALAQPQVRDGYRWLEVALPLAERPEMPGDAPVRFTRPEVLRVGSYASWSELSARMAPLYTAAYTVDDDSPVAAQAAEIMRRASSQKERAALALQLVQDQVGYLLNGLNGGNYLPQTADETWAARYGDCKAKTVLLTAILRRMGIDAEPVLVSSQGGDAVPELLPLPLAFDHVIVRAVIDGEDYWLDGTSAAARLATLGDVPPFRWALPIREDGSELVAMTTRDPAVPQLAAVLETDHTAGVDLPALSHIEMRYSGAGGAQVQQMADGATPDQLRRLAATMAGGGADGNNAVVYDIAVSYDREGAVGTIRIDLISPPAFQWQDGRLEAAIQQGIDGSGFNPDRSRPAWRDIPVATAGPARQRTEMRLTLPDGGNGFTIRGTAAANEGFGNIRVERDARIEDGVLIATAETIFRQGEIAPADLPAARREARRMASARPQLMTPPDVTWRWELAAGERRRRIAPIIAAYSRAIDFADADDFGPLASRAVFLESVYEFEDALADYNLLERESPSAWVYQRRSTVLEALGRPGEAIEDMRAAYDLEPDNGIAFALAGQLAHEGRFAEAQELVDSLSVGEDDAIAMADAQATVAGLAGDTTLGLDEMGELVARRPNNGDVLNNDCWFRGRFAVGLEDALDLCTRAVERAEFAAPSLDSRALVRFRLGQTAEALADLDAALALSPGLSPSIYLRGVIRLTTGDRRGREDIATALAMSPQIADYYAHYGIRPPA